MAGRVFTGNPGGNPQPALRARAAIAGFLKRHRQTVSASVPAHRAAPAGDAGEPGAVPDACVLPAPARHDDYPVYAVHFANRASGRYAAQSLAAMDDEAVFRFACDALGEGLGLGPREAAELTVAILLRTPHNADGSELDDAQIRSLSQDELRWILIADIARRDAETVLAAFDRGEETVCPPQRDVEPLSDLLGLPAFPEPDRPGATAKGAREPDGARMRERSARE